jgi:hypothetical protein
MLPYAALVCGILGYNRMSFGGVLAKVILSPGDSFARDVRYYCKGLDTVKDVGSNRRRLPGEARLRLTRKEPKKKRTQINLYLHLLLLFKLAAI